MEIIVGKTAGFCYGVKRAVEGATQIANHTKNTVYCLGEIVHNRQVIEKLENLGIQFIQTIEEANETVIIRAHGVPKKIYSQAKDRKLKVCDYTCPKVLKVQEIAKNYSEKGFFIFLLGDREHPENIATISHCGKDYYILEKEEDIIKAVNVFENTNRKKLLLLSQTTYHLEKFNKIEKKIQQILKRDVEFVIKNTICRATALRQEETEDISKKVEQMIIIGGKNSSNTKKLYEIAKRNCENTILVETIEELKGRCFFNKIGIMAGASTPKDSIESVIHFLNLENRKKEGGN